MSLSMIQSREKLEAKLNKEVSVFFHKRSGTGSRSALRKNVTYDVFLSDKLLIIEAIRAGIPYSLFQLIQSYVPLTENDWAELLDISTKSLQRYKQAARHIFKPLQSEKIIEMAEVTKAGLEVFDTMEKFSLWLNTPNFALGNVRPKELLKDSYGKELVMGELTRINYGILS